MLLFEAGDLIQRHGTGEVGIVIESIELNDFSYSSLGIPQAYESMMRVRTGMQTKKIPAYRVSTTEGIWIWEHREIRLITPRPPTKPEECP